MLKVQQQNKKSRDIDFFNLKHNVYIRVYVCMSRKKKVYFWIIIWSSICFFFFFLFTL